MTMIGPCILAIAAFIWAAGGDESAFHVAGLGVVVLLFEAGFWWEERQEREWRRRFSEKPWESRT